MSPLYQPPPTECKHMLFNVLHGMQWHNGWIRVIDSTRQAEEARHSPATNPVSIGSGKQVLKEVL